jgi:hypothetical protein
MATRRRFNSLMCVALRTASFTERALSSWYALHLHTPLSFSSLPSLFFERFPSHTLSITRVHHCAVTKTRSCISVLSQKCRANVVNPHLSTQAPSQECPASSVASATTGINRISGHFWIVLNRSGIGDATHAQDRQPLGTPFTWSVQRVDGWALRCYHTAYEEQRQTISAGKGAAQCKQQTNPRATTPM